MLISVIILHIAKSIKKLKYIPIMVKKCKYNVIIVINETHFVSFSLHIAIINNAM